MVNNRENFVWLVNALKSCRIAKDSWQTALWDFHEHFSHSVLLLLFSLFFNFFFYLENNALWMNTSSFMRILATTFFMVEILSS